MPGAFPVDELITQDLVAVLSTIVKGDIADPTTGRLFTWTANVERTARLGNSVSDGTVVVHLWDTYEVNAGDQQCQLKEWWQSYLVQLFVVISEDDTTTPVDQVISVRRADIERVVMQDTGRSGNAMDTIIHAPIHFTRVKGASEGTLVQPWCRFRTSELDPYTQR